MATVAALFGSQGEATKALDAMAGTQFEDVETTVYDQEKVTDEGGEGAPEVRVAMAPSLRGGVLSTSLGEIVNKPIGELSDPAVSDFFVREVKKRGATLIVATVDDERADALEQFFDEHGGRTTEEA